MTLPTFLGIGVPKAGTTWLYRLLDDHPRLYVSQRVKEVHYFDRNYHQGRSWYETFFPDAETAGRYSGLGEITPSYFHNESCPARIADLMPDARLILLLRNPIDRAWSNYLFRSRLDNYQGTFEEFMEAYPGMLKRSTYAPYLQNYLDYFAREQLLVLLFEQVFSDIEQARAEIAAFLGVDGAGFAPDSGYEKINESFKPRFGQVNALATRVLGWASRHHHYWIINLAKRAGMKKMLAARAKEASPSMKPQTRQELQARFEPDICRLEDLLGWDLSLWREAQPLKHDS